MSTQKLVYEGPDPERLLLDVWKQHGPDAQISEPERIAKGGVFGFFAKSHYRVEVHVRPGTRGATKSTTMSSTEAALGAMVDDIEDVYEAPTQRRGSFEEVLAGVASSLGEDPATFAARDVGNLNGVAAPAATSTGVRPDTVGSQRPAEGLRMLLDLATEPDTRTTAISGDPIFAGVIRHQVQEQPLELLRKAGFPGRLISLLESRGLTDFSLEAAFALLPPVPPMPKVPGALIAIIGPLEEALSLATAIGEELGLPASEIALALPAPASRPLIGRGGKAPAPTPAELAAECVAADLLVTDAESTAALAPGWRRDRVGVVAVAVDDTTGERAWAREVLRAARPSFAIALADARTKNEDLATFLGGIGGVDALALHRTDSTVSPAQLLGLGLPVARLEGSEVSSTTWARIIRDAAARRAV